MIARLVGVYVAIFAIVLLALSLIAYTFVGTQYHSLLLPALTTPEGAATYASAMRRVALTIVAFDVPLVILVGIASWLLARVSVSPLIAAQERERRFIADAAHGLRSPLATIASVAQAEKSADPATREALSLIARTALDAGALVGDLLTLARSPGPSVLTHERVDFGSLVEECVRELQSRAAQRGVRLEARTESSILDGDPRRLRELARNLLDNALRYARASVDVRCFVQQGKVRLVVTDDGPGIDPAIRPRLFERFARSEESAGSGLGLAIAHWVATAHAGTLWAETGKGTTFVAELPCHH